MRDCAEYLCAYTFKLRLFFAIMVNKSRSCFVPGCKTGYPKMRADNAKLGVKNKSLFKVTVSTKYSIIIVLDVH